jgi:hypothetical protein
MASETPRTEAEQRRNAYGWDLCRLLERESIILLAALEGVARRGSPLAREALIAVGKLRKEHDDSRRTLENA